MVEYLIENGLSIVTTIIAIFSPFITLMLWERTNRPIVWAVIESMDHGTSKKRINYNLTVVNVGNRPAVDIQLQVDPKQLDYCRAENITDKSAIDLFENSKECFSQDTKIPLLADGGKKSNIFGLHNLSSEHLNIWKYGSTLPIEITYKDHRGKQYTSQVNLLLKYSEAFAGIKWGNETMKKELSQAEREDYFRRKAL